MAATTPATTAATTAAMTGANMPAIMAPASPASPTATAGSPTSGCATATATALATATATTVATATATTALPIVNRLWPDEWRKVVADPAIAPNATQELIRWQTPLAHMRRTALEPHEIGGRTIPAGAKVVLWYLSGNRDETVFADASRFVADRENARRHLAFGFGIHRCVGARLAELQLATLIEVLLERGLTPVADGEPERVPSCFVHGYRKLPARLVRT